MKIRIIETEAGKFLNLKDMVASLSDEEFIRTRVATVMKVAHGTGEHSSAQILAIAICAALLEWSGDLAELRQNAASRN